MEALQRANDREQFIDNLIKVRYKDGVVSEFANRKHFFTDWSALAPAVATDITSSLGANSIQVTKNLNKKGSGGVYLPDLPIAPLNLSHTFPVSGSTAASSPDCGPVITSVAYAEDGGLDVTHVGIFVDKPDGPFLRNASSLRVNNKVVDSPLLDYLKTVPGIVVLRPVA